MRVRMAAHQGLRGIAEFTVFVSYRRAQSDAAERVRDMLAELDFRVLMISPHDYRQYDSEDDLVAFLRGLANQADAVCVIVSAEAVASRWVNVEIAEAASVIGRVLFVSDPGLPLPASYAFHEPVMSGIPVRLVVKHTTIGPVARSSAYRDALVCEILNDPEEGWFEEASPFLEPWLTRDIKAELEMRKFARRCLMVDGRCEGHTIRDVMAFAPRSSPVDDRSELFGWYAEAFGRPALVRALGSGELLGFHTFYHAPSLRALREDATPFLDVLYTRVPGIPGTGRVG